MIPIALTIAGSDPCGGAGIQADLKVFHRHGVYGMSVLTLLTVQNTRCVDGVLVLEPDFVREQLNAVVSDIPPKAAKTGALGNSRVICEIANLASSFSFPLVVDPVMISKHGAPLIDEEGRAALKSVLLSRSALVTPNIPEAEELSGLAIRSPEDMETAARFIARLGPPNVLVKGGHRQGTAMDVLLAGESIHRFTSERLDTKDTHGTGCVLSAAITAWLARGADVVEAVARAKSFVTKAISTAPGLGHGLGPTNMWAEIV